MPSRDNQDEATPRGVGNQVSVERADEWPQAFLDCLGAWKEDIPRPPANPVGRKVNPQDPA
jgi:hypothetical protein